MRIAGSRVAWAGFELAFRPWMRRRLDGVHVRGAGNAAWVPAMPLLLVANHVSWWDGFLLREVHRRVRPGAPLHVVMSARELRRHPYLGLLGAVPLERTRVGPRRLLDALAARVDAHPEAVLGYFPQGRLWPSHRRPLEFSRGAAWLAGRLSPLAVVPVGLHLQPLARPAPAAFVSVGRPFVAREEVDPCRLEREVTGLLNGILDHVAEHGEDAALRWGEP